MKDKEKMRNKGFLFRLGDGLCWILMLLPFVIGILLKILFSPATEGIVITGAQIYAVISMPWGAWPVTEAQLNSMLVMLFVWGLCLYLTHGIRAGIETRRRVWAEWIVEMINDMVIGNMGDGFSGFAPFIAAILALSAFSSISSLIGLFPPTSDINITAGWALLVFILITYYKMKRGLWRYIKSFGEPVAVLAPMNIISELATPVSMAFRHYGNILAGTVVSVLVASGLTELSRKLFGALPGVLGEFPYLRIGIPAVLSVYFDVFSGCLQAYIFAILTMLYVSNASPIDHEKRRGR